MTYTNIFKASKFIAVHFRIALTMEILIVQIFILDFIAFEGSQAFWHLSQSFTKIYIVQLQKFKQVILYSKRLHNAFLISSLGQKKTTPEASRGIPSHGNTDVLQDFSNCKTWCSQIHSTSIYWHCFVPGTELGSGDTSMERCSLCFHGAYSLKVETDMQTNLQ